MRTAKETANLAFSFLHKKNRVISAVFFFFGKWRIGLFFDRQIQDQFFVNQLFSGLLNKGGENI